MKFHVLTLFPDMIRDGFQTSITGRAVEKGLLSLETVNIRDFSVNKHNRVDDYPYGGGAGMVMQAEPVCRAYESVAARLSAAPRVLYMSPQGKVFDQRMAEELAKEQELVFLCGHYEGIDERVLEEIVTDEVSIGDYVLTGGELPALVIMDAVSRLKSLRNSILFTTICWNIPSTAVRRSGEGKRFRRSCCPGITPMWNGGGGSSLFSAREIEGRICWKRRILQKKTKNFLQRRKIYDTIKRVVRKEEMVLCYARRIKNIH